MHEGLFLCARHGADVGGASPVRADRPVSLAEGNCVAARRGGKEAGRKIGDDEQEPDRRPARWAIPAVNGEVESQTDTGNGKSGGNRVKDHHLALGGHRLSPDGSRSRMAATSSEGRGEVSGGHRCAGQRMNHGGGVPLGAWMRSAVSEGGGNSSLVGRARGY
jgi:hypothetical protein